MAPNQVRPEHLAEAMGIDLDKLWSFARHIDAYYKPRRVQWDGKKHRPIDPLYNAPKKLLRRLHGFFQRNRLCHAAAHGGVRKRSCFSSARVHVGHHRSVWTRDVKNCYPSISPSMMLQELRSLGFRHNTARVLTMLFTYRGGVPQGSPISGDALNLYFWRLDHLMASMAGSESIGYSRVADDFVISGKRREASEKVVARLEAELESRGINVNEKKKRESGFQTCSEERLVHNISVSKPRGTAISRNHSQEALALATKYVAACRSVTAYSIQAVAAKRSTLSGWMHYCRQAEFGPARTIKQQIAAGDRHILKKLRKVGVSSKKSKWWIIDFRPRRGNQIQRNEPKRIATVWRKRLEQITDKDQHVTSTCTINKVPVS